MKTRKKLNLRFLTCLLVVVAVLGVGVHLVHGFQVKRNASALLGLADNAKADAQKAHADAEEARKRNDLAKEKECLAREDDFLATEMDYLMRYLGIVRRDNAMLARYSEALDEKGKKTDSPRMRMEAFMGLENVLRNEPGRVEIRERQVRTAIYLGRFDAALAHVELLLKAKPKEKEVALLRDKGFCLAAMKKDDEARKTYEEAIAAYTKTLENNPAKELDAEEIKNHIGDYWNLAGLYRERLKDPKKANETLDAMVKEGKKEMGKRGEPSFAAYSSVYLLRARAYLQYEGKDPKSIVEARLNTDQARAKAPNDTDVVLEAAEVERADGSPKAINDARKLLTAGIKEHPAESRLYLSLIALEVREDDLTKALELARQGLLELKDKPDDDVGKSNLRHTLADILVQRGELEEAQEHIAKLKKSSKVQKPLLDYLQARILVREGKWKEASKLLDEVNPKLSRVPNLQAQALLLFGQCYEQLNNPDLALKAYQRALELEPLSPAAHYRIGSLYLARGRREAALQEYRSVLTFSKKAAGMNIVLARTLIAQYAELPQNERRRGGRLLLEARQVLSQAAKETPDAADIPIMQAEILLLEDPKKIESAHQIITTARAKFEINKLPGEASLWIAEAQLTATLNSRLEDGLAVLKKALERPHLVNNVDLWLAKLGLLVREFSDPKNNSPEKRKAAAERLNEKLKAMEQGANKLSSEGDRSRLFNGLASAYLGLSNNAEADRLWKEVAKQQPNNLSIRLVLHDLALLKKSKDDINHWLEEMHRIEGDPGVYWRYAEASRLVQEAQPAEKEELSANGRHLLEQAREHLKMAKSQRSSWPRISTLLGGIDELESKFDDAIENYKEALRLGERRPEIVRRTVGLLSQHGQKAEAEKLVGDLLRSKESLTLLRAGLGKQAVENLLANPDSTSGDKNLAEALAEQSVSKDSKSYQDQLWLGRYKWITSKGPKDVTEARNAFNKACELAGSEPETWVTLVAFLASTGNQDDKKQAEVEIEKAKKQLPAEKRALALATCYDNLGDLKRAEEFYLEALKPAPQEMSLLRRLANFYLRRGLLAQAERSLRTMLELGKNQQANNDVLWARRGLSAVLATNNSRKQYVEAVELIDANLRQDPASQPDKHSKALLFATRTSTRKQAIRLFKELSESSELPANERFTLAQLYLAEGKWDEAQTQMLILLETKDGKNPAYEASFARSLIERGDLGLAQRQLDALKKALPPESPLILEIEVRLLHANKSDNEALTKVLDYAGTKDADLVRTSEFLESLGQTGEVQARKRYIEAAGNLLTKHNQTAGTSESLLKLAAFLGRQQQIDKALDFCEQAEAKKANPEEVGRVLADAFRRAGAADERTRSHVEQKLGRLLSNNPGSVKLMTYLADVFDLEERFDKAEELYRKALSKDSDDVIVLNNLAWLLAFKDLAKDPASREEALAAINKAIDRVGEGSELLDTRGVIFLEMGQTAKAVADLQTVIERVPSSNYFFHLARALSNDPQKMDAANSALKEANAKGFDLKLVHPLERKQAEEALNKISQWQAKPKR